MLFALHNLPLLQWLLWFPSFHGVALKAETYEAQNASNKETRRQES